MRTFPDNIDFRDDPDSGRFSIFRLRHGLPLSANDLRHVFGKLGIEPIEGDLYGPDAANVANELAAGHGEQVLGIITRSVE
jgi:hypothetical protein